MHDGRVRIITNGLPVGGLKGRGQGGAARVETEVRLLVIDRPSVVPIPRFARAGNRGECGPATVDEIPMAPKRKRERTLALRGHIVLQVPRWVAVFEK